MRATAGEPRPSLPASPERRPPRAPGRGAGSRRHRWACAAEPLAPVAWRDGRAGRLASAARHRRAWIAGAVRGRRAAPRPRRRPRPLRTRLVGRGHHQPLASSCSTIAAGVTARGRRRGGDGAAKTARRRRRRARL